MNYFTRAWTQGQLSDAQYDAALPAYQAHLATLDLPASLRDLAALPVHDARIHLVAFDPPAATLALRLTVGDLQRGYADVSLSFAGVSILPAHLALFSQSDSIEIHYDEIDRAGPEQFAYRLLLLPAGEADFTFRSVSIHRQAAPDGRAR